MASSHEWQIIDLASKINKKTSCNIDKHFTEETNHSIEDLDVQIIVQLENIPRDKDQAIKMQKTVWRVLPNYIMHAGSIRTKFN